MNDTKPHAPGTWIVYFSLAALALLVTTTSFLGLRRYLRQRKLTMPGSVTRAWLTTGGGLILVIMLLCLLLPRPQSAYSLTHVIDRISTKIGKASHNALVKGEAGEGDGKRIGKRDDKNFDLREAWYRMDSGSRSVENLNAAKP